MSKSTNLSKRGFTLVELLIVIVVIAILAAISIVAYNGVQNRGKTSAAQSLAAQVQKKAEIYNTIDTGYPTYAELAATTSAVAEAQLDDPSKVTNAATTDPSDESTVGYRPCTTGAQVEWWSATAGAIQYIGLGGASSTAACS